MYVRASLRLALGVTAVCGAVVYGCSSSPSTPNNGTGAMKCAVGSTASCQCPNGSISTQLCDATTLALSPCQCGGSGAAGITGQIGGAGISGVAGTNAALAGTNGGVAGTLGTAGDGAAGIGAAGMGAAGTGSVGGTSPTILPTAKGSCPPLTNGSNTITVNGKTMKWTIWIGSKSTSGNGGPIILYWHGTGTNAQEAITGLSMAAITEVTGMGGLVASAEAGSNTGTNTGDNVWFTGDADFSDEIIACAMKQLTIDTRHIHTAGYSAGALQSAWMYSSRSGYIASVVAYSGGASGLGGGAAQDPTNIAPVIGAHGSTSGDFLAQSSLTWQTAIKGKGAFVIDCDDGGSHVDITRLSRMGPAAWRFFKDHPFKVGTPDPYAAGLPADGGFPTYCKIY